MREIIFRGIQTENGKWKEGFFAKSMTDKPMIMPDVTFATRDMSGIIYDSMDLGRFYFVIPESVGQFTGLLDKNGKKIFEGDILKYHSGGENCFRKVVFRIAAFHSEVLDWKPNNNKPTHPLYFCSFTGVDEIEVVGNINDNPELLK